MNPKTIVLNKITQGCGHVANFMCLVVKQFIYRQRCLKENLHFPIIKKLILNIENIEKYIAVKNGKEQRHIQKWGKL